MIDQRKLPRVETYIDLEIPEQVADAIRDMVVRGAPAIGCSAAFGLALGATQAIDLSVEQFDRRMETLYRILFEARPTAVNLGWAVERMRDVAKVARADGLSNRDVAARLEADARAVHAEDLESCRAMGRHGATLVPAEATILTHCNAGGLATAGYGTALGVVRGAVEAGKKVRVIDTTLIVDNCAGSLMHAGEIDLVVVGSDRIAANGDVANKIGTYSVAVLARENKIPFYVAAPLSTIDFACPDGSKIPIEERDPLEVTEIFGTPVAPEGVNVRNLAFDVTPARYVEAIITERGIARKPYDASLRALRES